MLGGGATYQLPEVLAGKTYDKSVDLFMYGLLCYEMLTGEPAFPMLTSEEEQEERIKNCKFTFPDEDPNHPANLNGPCGTAIVLTYSEVSDGADGGKPKRTMSGT